MNLDEIRSHWGRWSKEFGTDLKATTKTFTIKKLEINAIYNAIRKMHFEGAKDIEVLEVGCGNGYNCFALSELLQNFHFTGVDYIPDMIKHAKIIQDNNAQKYSRITFHIGDILTLENNKDIKDNYDIIFTDRCLINLNSIDLQLKAVNQLLKKLKQNGYLIILENFIQNYTRQNDCRESVGLPKRKPVEYNLFIDEDVFVSHLKKSMELVHVDDFASLHDIILYVLIPMINNGERDYDHPLVKAATDLSISISDKYNNSFGSFGQNRLFLFHNVRGEE